jgi:hypothetical protein
MSSRAICEYRQSYNGMCAVRRRKSGGRAKLDWPEGVQVRNAIADYTERHKSFMMSNILSYIANNTGLKPNRVTVYYILRRETQYRPRTKKSPVWIS